MAAPPVERWDAPSEAVAPRHAAALRHTPALVPRRPLASALSRQRAAAMAGPGPGPGRFAAERAAALHRPAAGLEPLAQNVFAAELPVGPARVSPATVVASEVPAVAALTIPPASRAPSTMPTGTPKFPGAPLVARPLTARPLTARTMTARPSLVARAMSAPSPGIRPAASGLARAYPQSRVDDLRVLGAAPVAAPSGGFDPAAAVTVSPPPAPAPQRATSPRMRPQPAAQTPAHTQTPARTSAPQPSPEVRWRTAVASRPLETPRQFPSSLRPLVTALTGAQRVSYTAGPATRHALAAAGAHGATTGSVVHLPTAPTPAPGAMLGVVAHELAHARYPVARPRFLLGIPHGAADMEERAALAVGRRVESAASGGLDQVRAGIVDQLPVGGLGQLGGAASQARAALTGAVPDLPDVSMPDVSLPDVQLPQVPSLGALPGLPGGLPGGITDAANAAANTAVGAVSDAVQTPGGTPGGASPPSNVDIDRLAETLEQRILRQLERRGGRYAGVF
ncbi:MAG: hypothetical protein AUI14_03425 [Actinobacteria bacterium 13_2_20CM_2_71_6]|nr:MAG: hypothetical protein AUI14_03425 [Actinobacteria bacterium 13_2_20CM_2_71_6]